MSRGAVSDATGRILDRQRSQRRRRWLRLGIAAGCLLVIAGLLWAVMGSPLLAVKNVAVSGNRVLSTEEVRRVAAVPNGRPLVWVDPSAVADRVAGLPAVQNVTVTRVLPDTIEVRVVERTAQFALRAPNGYLLVDSAGVIFQAVNEKPPGLMVAELPSHDPATLADLAIVTAALGEPVRSQVRSVTATTRDNIVLDLGKDRRIVWGSSDQSVLKGQIVVSLLSVKAKVYDVSSPSHPTTR